MTEIKLAGGRIGRMDVHQEVAFAAHEPASVASRLEYEAKEATKCTRLGKETPQAKLNATCVQDLVRCTLSDSFGGEMEYPKKEASSKGRPLKTGGTAASIQFDVASRRQMHIDPRMK